MKKKIFKIEGMHCSSCSLLIEDELEDLGVKARVSYQKATAEVEFDENVISEEKIGEAIKKVGYKAVS